MLLLAAHVVLAAHPQWITTAIMVTIALIGCAVSLASLFHIPPDVQAELAALRDEVTGLRGGASPETMAAKKEFSK